MRRNAAKSRVAPFAALVASVISAVIGLHAARAGDGAAVAGVVRFAGPRPERKPIQMMESRGKESECMKAHATVPLSESALVSEKGEVANVFVYIKKGLEKKEYPAPEKPAVINQNKCMFRPRVLGVMVGQKLHIKNSDALLHNVRSFSRRNRAFNIAQPPATKIREKTFRRPESAVKITCDIHKWMTAYIFAVEHPYFAVTPENGKFRIRGLPAGDYTLAAWHELYGEQEANITVGASGSTEVDFTFKPVKPKS